MNKYAISAFSNIIVASPYILSRDNASGVAKATVKAAISGVITRGIIGEECDGILSAMHEMGKFSGCIGAAFLGIAAAVSADNSASVLGGAAVGAVVGYAVGAGLGLEFAVVDNGIMQPLLGGDNAPFIWE